MRVSPTRASRAGQGLVEAAVCIPLLAVLLFFAVSGATAFRSTMLAESASAEGARYAAQHTEATDDEIESWTRQSIGADAVSCDVTVTRTDLSEQDYTMRIVDSMGNERTANARTVRRGVTVTVTMPVELVGFGSWETHSTHTGIQATEGVAR